MLERRRVSRFDLEIPALIEAAGTSPDEVLEARTKDISAHGVYLHLADQRQLEGQVRMSLVFGENSQQKVRFVAEGMVVRSSPGAAAIQFNTAQFVGHALA